MLYEICCTIIFALFFPVLLKYILHLCKCRNMPPGPIPLPLIGNFHLVSHKPLHLVLTNLCQKYGDVFSISLGIGRCVIINDIDTAIKTLTLKSFSGRPSNRHFVFLYSRARSDGCRPENDIRKLSKLVDEGFLIIFFCFYKRKYYVQKFELILRSQSVKVCLWSIAYQKPRCAMR